MLIKNSILILLILEEASMKFWVEGDRRQIIKIKIHKKNLIEKHINLHKL